MQLYVTLCFCLVLVSLYEQPEKPGNALEYPSTHKLNYLQTLPLGLVVGRELSLGTVLIPAPTTPNQNIEKCLEVDSLTNSFPRFVKQHLNCGSQTLTDTEALQQEVVDLRLRCVHLTDENKNLKSKVRFDRFSP